MYDNYTWLGNHAWCLRKTHPLGRRKTQYVDHPKKLEIGSFWDVFNDPKNDIKTPKLF